MSSIDVGIGRPSTPALIGDALKQVTSLFSAELQLARIELTEKVVIAVAAVAALMFAAVFSIVALIFLLQGVVEILVHYGFVPFVASFIVGGVILVVALLTVLVAVRRLSGSGFTPERTIRQAKGATGIVTGKRR